MDSSATLAPDEEVRHHPSPSEASAAYWAPLPMAERHIEVLGPKHDDEKKKNKKEKEELKETEEMEEMKETAGTSSSLQGPGEVAVKATGMMLTGNEMAEVMANHRSDQSDHRKRKKGRKGRVRVRKDAVLLTAAVQALFVMPRRIARGPIYPSFNWVTELGYRAVIKVVDHHYLLRWDDLRGWGVPPVRVNEFVKGEFVCYSPSMQAERRHGRRGVRLEADFERDKVENNTTIFFIHGGGFCMGEVTTYRQWAVKMSKLLGGIQFFLMDYGLSPENQFPTALRQCWKTYLWLIDEKVSVGGNIPPERLIIAGDSAGGNLSLSLLFLIRQARLNKQMRDERRTMCDEGDRADDDDYDCVHAQNDPDICNPHAPGPAAAAQHNRRRRGTMEMWMLREEDRLGRGIQDLFGHEMPHYDQAEAAPTTTRGAEGDESEIRRRREYRRRLNDEVRADWRATGGSCGGHCLPFELDEHERELFPPFPLCAMLLSPWVDLSEHSSAFRFSNYPKPAVFRPYHIGLRFVHAYLGLQPTDYPFTVRKNRELERRFKWGLRAQVKAARTKREKDQARIRSVAIRAQTEYLRTLLHDELRMRQVVKTREELRQHRARQRQMSVDMVNVKEGTTRRHRVRHHIGHGRGRSGRGAADVAGDDSEAQAQREAEEDELDWAVNRASIYSPYVSPIYGDLLGLPPLLVTGGDQEPLWDDIQRLVQKGRDQGLEMELVVGEQMNHDFQFFFEIVAHPEVAKFLDRVKEWFRLQLEIIGEGVEVDRLKRKDEAITQQDREEARAEEEETVKDKSKQLLRGLSRLPSLAAVL
ncbi:alpha/beta hydrolase fold domain containing protein [Acanthamoeba castellanii str. Neff]|uniref:Alpha/beta hydrolase fold domain containing protein n=1 Tax=Acanthamoeba castellanii (strain ATCC 30010 / Neff) TaxID=1257118 RepID=L8HDN1_ACACF|nr:alpha/beta hydrolase fold domain containing protein [Acanthamoeba castellanii str. Neff]ELR22501.1 alpha/beta hydrolase fold domain containing protein [Acanthamoeba castellanii str. Neff]